MVRLLLIGVLVSFLSGFANTEALAQRDGGAKARGDSRNFWDPSYRRSAGDSFEYRPQRPSVESYRSFSYEPIGINPGDTVMVDGDDIKMMKGANVVGLVPNGLTFKVTRVINGWLGAVVEVDGQKLNGWIRYTDVTHEADASVASGQAAYDEGPTQSYRRFSYEPRQPSRTLRTYENETKSWRWQYPKTDPWRPQR
jgi:hypothetical protein